MLNLTNVSTDSLTPELPATWKFFRTPPAHGAYNMAFDSAMMTAARAHDVGIWRCYGWDQPTVSFGRNESVAGRFDRVSVERAGLGAVRRPTGGRALLHASEVTYSVAVPVAGTIGWQALYAAINAVLLRALQALGAPAELALAPHETPMRPNGPVCFDQPAYGEIVVHGAKLVGSAVWRERGAYLQHGSILLHDDQAMLQQAMVTEHQVGLPPIPPAASLSQCLSVPPNIEDVEDALEAALRAKHNNIVVDTGKSAHALIDQNEVRALQTHYLDPHWLWRR